MSKTWREDPPRLEVGQEVRVFDGHGRGPRAGYVGRVVEIRRTLFDVEWNYSPDTIRPYRMTYRLDDGGVNQKEGSGYVRTLAQVDESRREAEATKTLREHKVILDYGHGFTLDQLEAMAALLVSFKKPDPFH